MDRKTYTKNEIKQLLITSDKAVVRGLVAIFQLQTQNEQYSDSTSELNGVGFNGLDAKFGCSLAKQILSQRSLSLKQIEAGRKLILKYAGQLMRIANSRQATLAA